ncbi:uncharacterized protein [Palaemon carinicauda]|uniref:uncharacterized protein n=1 Tax=Palaemon carinicauda TaxID=392227 RepID=UPI0035B60F40
MKMDAIIAIVACRTLFFHAHIADAIRVLSFNSDGQQRGDTWIRYNTSVDVPRDYTLCVRFNIKVFRILTAVIYLFNVRDFDDDPISFEVYFEKIRTKYGGYGRFYPLPSNLATNKWYHYCQVRDMENGEGRVYLDGQLIIQERTNFESKLEKREVFIGQDEYQPRNSLSGKLSQVNVWGQAISPDLISQLANCKVNQEGDVVNWSSVWELSNVEDEDVPTEDLCRSVSHGRVTVLLPLLKFREAVRVCKGIKGVIGIPGNTEALRQELAFFKNNENCERQWAGISDEAAEGVWYDPFSEKSYNTSEIYFRQNNPDGDKYQNCIRMNEKGLEDTDCHVHSCSACHTTASTTWTLRGICEEEERMYYLDLIPEPLAFRGYGEYFIEQTGDSMWTWYNTVTNVTISVLSVKDLNYPIGRRTWEVQTDVCGQNKGLRELTLTACTKSEFTCTDGSCIPFIKRCDLKFDCGDKTDESFCQIVNFPGDYRSKLPPRPASNEALPLSINFTMDTLNVDTTTMLMSVSYNLRITWFDNRLTYNNLKLLTRLNTLSLEEVEKLWRPKIGFINTDDIQNTAVDQDAVTTVLRRHPEYVPDLSNPYEVEIYRGDTNPISTTRKYFTIYTCNFDLVLYPFDIQTCILQLQILSASTEYLVFDPEDSFVEYLGPRQLVEYGIGTIDLRVENSTQYSHLKVEVELVRRYGYAMLNIYIPSLTLLVISYITLFFRPSIFDVRVMTALTALLVLATLFTQVSASLPKTSYFKMVDIWLLFCIMLIFVILLFHTVIDLKIDYRGVFNTSSTMDAGRGSDKLLSRGGSPSLNNVVTTMKVNPINGVFLPDESEKYYHDFFRLKQSILKMDALTYILVSKWTVFVIFGVFNLIYWGTLTVSSGLMYSV